MPGACDSVQEKEQTDYAVIIAGAYVFYLTVKNCWRPSFCRESIGEQEIFE